MKEYDMQISNACKNYFNGFHDVFNYKNNNNKTNALAVLKILSYFTLIIPLGFATVYGATSLYGRVSKKQHLSSQDLSVNDQVKKIQGETPIQKADLKINSVKAPKVELSDVLSAYWPPFTPETNSRNLQEYSRSDDYQRHAKTARIYYNSNQLSKEDALRIIFQREPTNIAMHADLYDKEKLNELFGYESSVYNDVNARKADGSAFKDLPNTASVYSETYLWDPPGGDNKKEIACLSLPAPALDSRDQPHYEYYMQSGELDAKKYEQEMQFLFKTIETVIRDNKDKAFGDKGIKRVVLSRFGQGAFLEALSPDDQEIAQKAYRTQLAFFLHKVKDTGIEIVMSEYGIPYADNIWHDKMIIGDIIETAEEGDLIINAWDPHSAPGNGNDIDNSFDGAMGKGSGIILTQTGWLNATLRSRNSLVAISF